VSEASRGQGGLQQLLRGRGELAQVEPDLVDPVGRQHAGPAAVGDHGQPLAHRAVARGQALGRGEQLDEGAHAHRARAAQRGVEHVVAAHDGRAVRLRGLVARGLAAGLEHHHRLGMRGRAQRAHEAARVVDAFEVHDDAVRGLVVGQEVEHLRNVDRGVRAQRHHAGEAHAVLACPVEHRGRERARLRHQRERPGASERPGHAGVQVQQRALEAQRVGPQQVHAFAPGDLAPLRGLVGADAAGENHRRSAADAPRDLQRRRHVARRQRDERQVGMGLRELLQRALGAHVEKAQRAVEAVGAEGFAQRAAGGGLAARVVRMADEGHHGSGREERVEEVLVHHPPESAPIVCRHAKPVFT
jgi:hypothetical protein